MLGDGQRPPSVTHTTLLITSGRALPTLSSQAGGGRLSLSIMLGHAYLTVSPQAESFFDLSVVVSLSLGVTCRNIRDYSEYIPW